MPTTLWRFLRPTDAAADAFIAGVYGSESVVGALLLVCVPTSLDGSVLWP